jgi:aspartate aminotransferase-like enzyme
MVVRAGREFLAIPGPTTIPDEVLRAMHRPRSQPVIRNCGPVLHLYRQRTRRVGGSAEQRTIQG